MAAQKECYVPVPEWPPLPAKKFASYEWWLHEIGGPHRLWRAEEARALVMERRGPRGGMWFAVRSRQLWISWAQNYNCRARRRWEGIRAAQVARKLMAIK